MKFGIFDHLEMRRDVSQAETFADRLKLIEQADQAGFHCWLTAEHHHSPLCMAPNQMVFLASAAARTTRIGLGSLVSVLPLHHPIRLLEEICMLDQLTQGRAQVGVGKGPTGAEFAMWGGNADLRQEMFDEAMIILLQGMQNDFLTFEGKHFSFKSLWMALRPVQKPNPPFWYGENGVNAGKLRANLVCSGSNTDVAAKLATYLNVLKDAKPSWQNGVCHNETPLYGSTRRVYLVENEQEAVERARDSYEVYLTNFRKPQPDDVVTDGLRKPRGTPPPKLGPTAISFEQGIAGQTVLVGTPAMARDHLRDYMIKTPANYYGLSFQWGNLTHAEASRSMELFAKEVMPLAEELSRISNVA